MRKKYTMTLEQYNVIIDASKPVVVMWVGGPPHSPQENANFAWQSLGEELGFEYMTVQPIEGSKLEFTAEERDAKS